LADKKTIFKETPFFFFPSFEFPTIAFRFSKMQGISYHSHFFMDTYQEFFVTLKFYFRHRIFITLKIRIALSEKSGEKYV